MANKLLTALVVNAAVFSVLFLLMLPLRKLLAKRISPALQLVLWAVLALKLVAPFGFESGLSLLPAVPAAAVPAQQPVTQADMPGYAPYPPQTMRQAPGANPVRPADADIAASRGNLLGRTDGGAAAPVGLRVDVSSLLLGIWAAGAMGVAAALGLGSAALRQRVRRTKETAPGHVLRAFRECKRALGIRREVRLAVQTALAAPAVTGVFRPVLALPGDAAGLDAQALRHVLMHELAHVKRGDLWAILLMNALCAAYWFAPPVWLYCRLVRADIETACDHRVLKELGRSQRLPYIATVLRYTARPQAGIAAAAMGISDGRPAMEKRVAGMFRAARTGFRGRLAAAALALVMLAASALTACRPDPTNRPVKDKKGDSFIGILKSAEAAKTPGASGQPSPNKFAGFETSWKAETIQVKPYNIKVDIDADIVLPNAEKLPVYIVLPEKITQEQVDGFLSQFGDVQYRLDMEIMTKADYQNSILKIQADIANLPNNKDYTDEQKEQRKKELEDAIRRLRQDMQGAPDTLDDVIEPKFTNQYLISAGSQPEYLFGENGMETRPPGEKTARQQYESTNTEAINVKWVKDNIPMRLSVQRSDELPSNSFLFYAGLERSSSEELSQPDKLKITLEEAKAAAENAVIKLGLDYMSVAGWEKDVIPTERIDLYDLVYDDFSKLSHKEVSYTFYFTRNINGVNETYCSNALTYNRYDEPWPYVNLSVKVDDTGITRLIWRSTGSKLGDMISDDSVLLSFDKIQEIAKQQFSNGNINFAGSYFHESRIKKMKEMRLSIDKIVLGYARVKLSDNSGRYVMVPVWDFFGSYYAIVNMEKKDMEVYSENGEPFMHSYLTINAIDGSVIDRSLGY